MPELFTTKTGVRKLAFGSQFILLWSNLEAMDLRSAKHQAFKSKYIRELSQWLHTIYATTNFTTVILSVMLCAIKLCCGFKVP
jgi:hypothetical protein